MRQTNLGTQPSNAAQARTAVAPRSRQQEERGYGQHSAAVAAAAKQSVGKRNRQPFELSLDNATLLGRRGNKGGLQMQLPGQTKDPSKLREEMVR